MKKGIDLSVYNEIKDYNQIKKNVDFVIIRTGYGKHITQKDKKFEEYYEHFKDIPLGVYHYSYASSKEGALREAENCIEFLKNKKLTLPVFYDLEDKTINVSKNILTDIAITFCEKIKEAGFTPGVYVNLEWMNHKINVDTLINKGYKIWLAQYTSKSNPSTDKKIYMWQYSSKGKVPGILGVCDMNLLYEPVKENLKTIEEIVKDVLDGKYGNGAERKRKLTEAGYNYEEIQKVINELFTEEIYYEVKKGDNLTKIAKKFNTTINELKKLNNIKNANLIFVGQKLRIR